VGLIQRVIEQRGIPTVSLSIVREYTEKVRPPRAIYLKWPFGHPLGEPRNRNQQAAVLGKALEAIYTITTPGVILDLKWQWRREAYPPAPWLSRPPGCKTLPGAER
jgi:D-proline reductase (dithiol) PrdB